MIRGDATEGFRQYLTTASASSAEPWQLDVLAAAPWPSWVQPTAATFEALQRALELASPPVSAQQTA